MFDLTLLEYVICGVLVLMAFICCLCCVCIKFSDWKMKRFIIKTAKKKGVKVDLDRLDPDRSCQSPHANENCSIFVPDVGIIL